PGSIETRRPSRPLREVEVEDRYFDAVVTEALQRLEHRQQLIVHVVGPQVEVDAVFHYFPSHELPTSQRAPARFCRSIMIVEGLSGAHRICQGLQSEPAGAW